MKCIRCNHDSKFKEREDGHCPKCRGKFAFEPRKGDKFTDMAFQNAIEAVSAKGQIRWGAEHLYYELARRLQGKAKKGCLTALAFTLAGGAGLLFLPFGNKYLFVALGFAIVGAVAVYYYTRKHTSRFVILDRLDFDGMLTQWRNAHSQPKTMITRAHTRGTPAPARKLEADIGDYSFDRAIICDRARTADILLANNFHFENNCAVLSVDGYPEAHFETIRQMLKRNPRLRVFALHDATASGCRLSGKLVKDPAWFAHLKQITDVGLRPAQVKAFNGLFLPHKGPLVQFGDGISEQEAEWLNQQSMELAVIRPEQVLKRMYKALHRDDADSGGDGGGDSSSSGTDGSGKTSDGASVGVSSGNSGGSGNTGGWGDGANRVVNDTESFTYEASDIDSDADGFG